MTIPMLAAGQVIAARYELQRPLGRKAGSSTWLARDLESGRDVAVRQRAPEEADVVQIAAHVQHPALLAPSASLAIDGRRFDVYELLPGGEIGRLRGRAWTLVLRRLLPMVEALAQLHDAGWVHGDLKSSNVLLDADGRARLVDFGSARRSGDPSAAGASPYSVSPERLDGAPASAADDIYAFGALLYELVGGHPPFYPDITPERVQHEAPAPLSGRPEPPDALCELVSRCLAKQPADRPATMREVHDALEQCLALAPVVAAAVPLTPRPPADAAPIRPQWQRPATSGPSASQLRREGFRRGLLAGAAVLLLAAFGFTFFVLPDMVESRRPRPAASTTETSAEPPPAPAAAPVDFARLAELKREMEERRSPLAERLQKLAQQAAPDWGRAEFEQASADLAAADAAAERREYEQALEHLAAMKPRLDALDQRVPQVVAERLAAARAAFDAGRSADAQKLYAAVLAVDAQHAGAKTGLQRAKVLDALLRETALAAQAEQAGDVATATAAFKRALALDSATESARTGLARLQARVAGDAFSAAIARAQAALVRRDYRAAEAAYQQAASLRPGAPEVVEGLQQVRRATETAALASTLEQATAAEREERWSDALRLHREALKGDPTLRAAQDGVARVEPRAALDAELQSYLDRPERMYSAAGRDVVRNILDRAALVPAPGPRLQAQVSRLHEMLQQAETPIVVALASDMATEVQIYRVGKLGLFEQKSLELMPGRYTVVGTRQGYRDVRKELNLLPGTPPPTVVVRCEEPI